MDAILHNLVFVVATPMTLDQFYKTSLLWQSLSKSGLLMRHNVELQVVAENHDGLPSVYNRFLDDKYAGCKLVYVHDDVSLQDSLLIDKMTVAHSTYDVVGLAGGDLAHLYDRSKPPLWHIMSDKCSGIVAHPSPIDGTLTSACFGPTPGPVNALDGLFISVDVDKALQKQVKWDTRFDFHFYDIAFSLTARRAGLTLGTWPIWAMHQGTGDSANSTSWQHNRTIFDTNYR